jgi:hypothetical protein
MVGGDVWREGWRRKMYCKWVWRICLLIWMMEEEKIGREGRIDENANSKEESEGYEKGFADWFFETQ